MLPGSPAFAGGLMEGRPVLSSVTRRRRSVAPRATNPSGFDCLKAIANGLVLNSLTPTGSKLTPAFMFSVVNAATPFVMSTPDRQLWTFTFYVHARQELEWFRGRCFEAQSGGFTSTFDGPARAIRCACAISAAAPRFGVDVRMGLHTGECDMRNDKVGGVAVDMCEQVAAHAGASDVLVSRTVKDLVAGSGLQFEDHGKHVLEGIPGDWRLFAVERGAQTRP